MVVANAAEGNERPPGVSQTINTMFHAHARVSVGSSRIFSISLTRLSGTKLRIVNTSLSTGEDSNAGRTEVRVGIGTPLVTDNSF